MNKKIILIIIIVTIIGAGLLLYQRVVRKEENALVLEEAFKGIVRQEVPETGTVGAGDEISLSFKSVGRIEQIDIKVGDIVERGQSLMALDTSQLFIHLSEAEAGLELARAELSRLLAGASQEKIKIIQTTINNIEIQMIKLQATTAQSITMAEAQKNSAYISLENARQRLIDVQRNMERELTQADEHGLNILDSVYLKIDSVFRIIDLLQRTHFHLNDQESIRVRGSKAAIETAKEQAKVYLQTAQDDPNRERITLAFTKMRQAIEITSTSLVVIHDICEAPSYRHLISSAERASLDAQRTNIAGALTSIINAEQSISSAQTVSQASINTAQGALSSIKSALELSQENLSTVQVEAASRLTQARGELRSAQRQLELIKAEPRQVDVALYRAQINRALAKKMLLERQIQENVLESPVNGKITQLIKKAGETVQPMEPVISLLPENPFQIEVNIYEEDVVKIEIGNSVEINLVAFPDETLMGKVISIDPTERLIGGVVFYETTIAFVQEPVERIKPGMTADIIITTAFRENVLIIDEHAIVERDNEYFIEVFKDGEIQEREIEIGLRGEDEMVEIISGLVEGEQVIIR